MLKEFKEFIMRGNLVDLAVGVIIGGAFGRIVSSLVNDIIMPPIGLWLNGVNFSNLFVSLDKQSYRTLAETQAAGAPTLNYGLFINSTIDFLIIALVIFLVIKGINRLRKQPASATTDLTTKDCPFCFLTIVIQAVR
jgi:large conductance mechanosensitive channel